MSCCGQTAAQALTAAQHTLDARTAAQTHVRLVYTGQDKRVRPFVAAGKVYQFGNNERRRVNVVAAAAVQRLMATKQFEVFDPERHNEDGTARQGDEENRSSTTVSKSPPLPVSLSSSSPPTETPQTGAEAEQGENTQPAATSPASAPAVQPAATVASPAKGRKK